MDADSTTWAQRAAAREFSAAEIAALADWLADPSPTDEEKAALLLSWNERGETPAEIAALAGAFRERARNPGLEAWASQAVDVCGTGGDAAGTFNLSTATTFVVAAGGVPVIKHGNRSITSKCGSADLFAALGFPLELSDAGHRAALSALGFTFLFAPAFHPAFRHVAGARRRLAAAGQRSVFNLLGPLLNPGRPQAQLVGVFSEVLVAPLADALARLGLRTGLVVHGRVSGRSGIDELTTCGSAVVAGFGAAAGVNGEWNPAHWGLAPARLEALAGGEAADNARLLGELFAGRGPAAIEDSVCLNAGAVFWLERKTESVGDGIELARQLIRDGAAADRLQRLRSHFGP